MSKKSKLFFFFFFLKMDYLLRHIISSCTKMVYTGSKPCFASFGGMFISIVSLYSNLNNGLFIML